MCKTYPEHDCDLCRFKLETEEPKPSEILFIPTRPLLLAWNIITTMVAVAKEVLKEASSSDSDLRANAGK